MGGLEPEDIADLERGEPHAKGRVFPIERVGHDRTEGPLLRDGALHERERNLGLGAEGRVGLAAGKPVRRRVGLDLERVVDALVGPQAGHGDHAVVGLAEIGEILAANVGGLVAVFAVTGLVNDEHAVVVGRTGRIGAQEVQALAIERVGIPGGLERNHCRLCAWRCCAPTTGSVLARAVSVLLRSAGSSTPSR